MVETSFKIKAPAKINLFLHVTGKLPNGYHQLQSLICFTELGDELEFFNSDKKLILEITGAFSTQLENSSDNIIYRAAELLATKYNLTPHGKIKLTKNLPVASGIGGGSSDAAAALIGLSRLWGIEYNINEFNEFAVRLGADVPACLYKKTLIAEGIGEKITAIKEAPKLHMVLVNPLTPAATAEVFKNLDSADYNKPLTIKNNLTNRQLIDLISSAQNNLTTAAIKTAPIIAETLTTLKTIGNPIIARLSGSGATCFALYAHEDAAASAEKFLQKNIRNGGLKKAPLFKNSKI